MNRNKCPKCGKLLIQPVGNPKSKILLVGDFPGFEEVRQGVCFVGRSGEVLQSELGRNGLQFRDCRMTNLWQHAEDEKECDITWHINQLVKEFKGKTHVLLMGSSAVRTVVGEKKINYAGTRLTLPDFKGIRIWASPNPTSVFHSPVGEFRISLERFVQDALH